MNLSLISKIRTYDLFRYVLVNTFHCRCIDFGEDPYTPCFGCDFAAPRNSDGRSDNDFNNFIHDHIDRQTGETFSVTRISKRIICKRGGRSGRRCRLRVSRAMQIRAKTYTRAQRFLQAEQYLSMDDVDILKYFQTLFV